MVPTKGLEMGSKYKDALVQELWEKEPSKSFENESGEEFRLYDDLEDFAGVILCGDEEGITGTFFEDPDELDETWDSLTDDDSETDEDED